MALDLAKLVGQIVTLAANFRAREGERRTKLDFALKTLKSLAAEFDTLSQKIEASKTTWLVAGLKEKPDLRQAVSPCPDDLIVLAILLGRLRAEWEYLEHPARSF